MRRPLTATVLLCALAALLAAPAAAQEPEGAAEPSASEAPPRPKPRPVPKRPPKPAPSPAPKAAAPEPVAPQPHALPLESYVEAATTTIIAEQSCPATRLNAGQLTNLRLAARVSPAQESTLEERLRTRAVEVRQRLVADGRDAWCAAALEAFGPAGTVAKGILAPTR